uniref:Uncharacterized protein n=1 Tax=Chromera velia CCMP2878 TaxID=1169474 RepID=A0A0G4HGZ2_9ALVE|eukprot:Cvel_27496.t1-p1 / transcript=Cvel_27496.t1 / gene=Cvel_27496 / organism=Chromera_velia_CCMP2878 / gene_product=hypothetical protein / transcript_product=hypothetical protein / location=Cvel_scaffold3439:13803-14602(+) / protein_length=156 / sequence_SO=supercontig / SO=protein_coding / is_pseudo=false
MGSMADFCQSVFVCGCVDGLMGSMADFCQTLFVCGGVDGLMGSMADFCQTLFVCGCVDGLMGSIADFCHTCRIVWLVLRIETEHVTNAEEFRGVLFVPDDPVARSPDALSPLGLTTTEAFGHPVLPSDAASGVPSGASSVLPVTPMNFSPSLDDNG